MKRRILVLALAVMMLLGSTTAYASEPTHQHEYTKSKVIIYPTEAKQGLTRHFCTVKVGDKECGHSYDEKTPCLPDVYISKYRHSEDGLRTRVTVAQNYKVVDGKLNITMENWFAKLMKDLYDYNWEGENVRGSYIEFKAKDIGLGTFDSKINEYVLTVPVSAITNCEDDAAIVLYLTTGNALVRLSEDATSALVDQAKESIGVQTAWDNDKLTVELLVDGEPASAPNGVEVLYWVKDAGDMETASKDILSSEKYMNFFRHISTDSEYDLVFVESLNGVVNCNK